jgi:uncharacterized protein (TIGR03083 family)
MEPARHGDTAAATAAERRDLAALLGTLDPARWDAASLCAGWRVREVVAHMTMPYRYSLPQFLSGMIRARGNFNRMSDRSARRDTTLLSDAELTAALRDNAEHPWKPPGGGPEGALSHDVIHGLDITVALGVDRRVPEARLRIVLQGMTGKGVRYFGADLAGVQLRADDMDWTFGSGAPLHGSAQDLLMVVCGRKLPAGRLRGAHQDRFTAA